MGLSNASLSATNPALQVNALAGLTGVGANNNLFGGIAGIGSNPIQNFGIGIQPTIKVPGMGNMLKPGSAAHAAAFHAKGPDYEIKLFVGGLAFQTEEADLIQYFKGFGIVADAIVMRDRATGKGRGFGFVKMQFANKE